MMKHSTIFLLIAISACTACTDRANEDTTMLRPPITPDRQYDKNSLYFKAWPSRPALFKLKDNLILQIPPQHQKFWEQRDWLGRNLVPRAPMPLEKIPEIDFIGFNMFMPDFSGYTPENYEQTFHEDLVQVIFISPAPMSSAEPGAPGKYPPNMFARRTTGENPDFDPTKYEERYGLRCYEYERTTTDFNTQWCYGLRDKAANEFILLHNTALPYGEFVKYPLFQTTYFTKKYGGLEITWRAHMKQFPHWQEIDQQIWKYIAAWNIAPKPLNPNN